MSDLQTQTATPALEAIGRAPGTMRGNHFHRLRTAIPRREAGNPATRRVSEATVPAPTPWRSLVTEYVR